jgi:hypothetical protein
MCLKLNKYDCMLIIRKKMVGKGILFLVYDRA